MHEGGQRRERAERTCDWSISGSVTARVTPHHSCGRERGRRRSGDPVGGQRARGGLVGDIGGGLRKRHSGVQLEAHLRVQELKQLAGAAPRLERLPVDQRARSASLLREYMNPS